MRTVWVLFIAVGCAVYVIVIGLILYCCIRYPRKFKEQKQSFTPFKKNTPIELTFIFIPIMIVTGLFMKTYYTEEAVEHVSRNAPNVVDVVAFRWSWRFQYPRYHISVNGTPKKAPTLVLPVGETTQINLTSTDVIHSMWVPAFMFKRDANPGYIEVFDYTPTRTGTFRGQCAEYCGTFHANMVFTVKVVTQAQYAAWLQQNKGTTKEAGL